MELQNKHDQAAGTLDPEAYLSDRLVLPGQQVEPVFIDPLSIGTPFTPVSADSGVVQDETTYHGIADLEQGPLDLDVMQAALTLNEAEAPSYTFEQVAKCIQTVDTALQGTNWEGALDHVTRLCFTVLIITFIMARRAYPGFPALADWGVIARMQGPYLSQNCLYTDANSKSGEPRWAAACFPNDQLMLGTGVDHKTLYIKNSNDTWTRLKMLASSDIVKWIEQQVEREKTDELITVKMNTEFWDETGRMVRNE